VYEICRQNRNQLVHFWFFSGVSGDGQLYRKIKKADWNPPEQFKNELVDIRRVAEEIKALAYHMRQLEAAINQTGRAMPNLPLPNELPLPPRLLLISLLVSHTVRAAAARAAPALFRARGHRTATSHQNRDGRQSQDDPDARAYGATSAAWTRRRGNRIDFFAALHMSACGRFCCRSRRRRKRPLAPS
jgi:hypothetical protein